MSLAIGSVVIGAVLVAVSGTGITGRKQNSQGQLTENGQIAINLMAAQLRMAGFWIPTSMSLSVDRPAVSMLVGCRDGFTNVNASWGTLACAAGPAQEGADALGVRYDGTEGGVAAATDCLGNSLAGVGGFVDDRFFIMPANATPTGNPALYCKGAGSAQAQMLMDDVEGMSLRYGVAAVVVADESTNRLFDTPAFGGESVTYMRANQLTMACPVTGPIPANSWCAVSSVRLCLVMRTSDGGADQLNAPYVDCNGDQQSSPDRRLRRAMTTTISIRNRTALPAVGAL